MVALQPLPFCHAHFFVALDDLLKGGGTLGFWQILQARARVSQPLFARVAYYGWALGCGKCDAWCGRWCGGKNGGDLGGDGIRIGVVAEVGGVGERFAYRGRGRSELGDLRRVTDRSRWSGRRFQGDAGDGI